MEIREEEVMVSRVEGMANNREDMVAMVQVVGPQLL